MAGLNLLLHIIMDNDPKRRNMGKHIVLISKWCIPVLSLIVSTITLASAMGVEISVSRIVPALVGILFIALGNYLPEMQTKLYRWHQIALDPEQRRKLESYPSFIRISVYLCRYYYDYYGIFARYLLSLPALLIAGFVPMIYSFVLSKKEFDQKSLQNAEKQKSFIALEASSIRLLPTYAIANFWRV